MTPIDRRRFLITATPAFFASGFAAAAPAIIKRRPSLTLAMSDALTGCAANSASGFVRDIEAASNCTIELLCRPIARAADSPDGWIGPAHDLVGLDPAFGYFGGAPGRWALSLRDDARWMANEGHGLYDELAAAHGFKALMVEQASACTLTSHEPLQSATALHGRRIWIRGLARDVANGLGAALCSSADDSPDIIDAERFDADPRHFLYRSLMSCGGAVVLMIRRDCWRSLDAPTKSALVKLAAKSVFHRRPNSDAKANRGLHPLPIELATAADAVTAAIMAEIATRSALTRKIDRSFRRARSCAIWPLNIV